MKKVLGLGLVMGSMVFAEEFNLDTEIKGEIKKTYEISREIMEDVTEVAPESTKIQGIDITNEVKMENVTGEVEKMELSIDDDLNLDLEIDEIVGEIDELIDEADSENYFKFGAGGYNTLDSFNYGLRYSNEIKEQNIDYKINVDRNIRGEDKDHSDVSSDLFNAEVNYEKYQLGIEHQINDYEYLGGGDRKLSETELSVKYEVESTPKNSIYAGVDLYRADSESADDNREYDNFYLHLYGEYDDIREQGSMNHILETKAGYYVDSLKSTSTSVLYGEAVDKLTHKDYEGYTFDINVGMEIVNKDVQSNNIGLNAGVKAIKQLEENLNVAVFINKEQKNQTTRDTMNNIGFVKDILMFTNDSGDDTELKPESNLTIGASVDYTQENLFGELVFRLVNSEDKISYSQTDFVTSSGTEKSIVVGNYDEDLSWTEIEAKAAYTVDNFRGELKTKRTTLEDLAYIPQTITTLSGIYDKDKSKVQADMNIYSDMYSEVKGVAGRYKLSGYSLVEVTYLHRFNSIMEGSVIVSNLLNAEKEILETYEIDERKITFECKVRY